VTIHSGTPGDLSALRIDRDAAPRRPWLLWATLAVLCAAGVVAYRRARSYVAERQAPEVEVARATQVVTTAGGSTDRPSIGAMNMPGFSELAFKFRSTPELLVNGLIFSAVMGAVGGLLPAIRAARIPVARALREI
jgi:hypothetical protein